jgi:SAM-dependent methyltransferase
MVGNASSRGKEIQAAVVAMYSAHPSPSRVDKLEYASRRMELRLQCCGIVPEDYRGRRLLDAGCGTGEYSFWFAQHGAEVTGIDLSGGSLDEARTYAAANRIDGVRFETRSVLDTKFDDASFDLVYCTGVLHHTPDPLGGLRELVRVLRPGGKILVSLYSSYGFLPREIRRLAARSIGGNDLDRRVQWGRRLFPLTARRLERGTRNDTQSALYDYFAIPHETLHSVGVALRWLDACGLEYQGTFPPTLVRDYPPMFALPSYRAVEREYHGAAPHFLSLLARGSLTRRRPGVLSRTMVQGLWLAAGVGVFSFCGRKPAA